MPDTLTLLQAPTEPPATTTTPGDDAAGPSGDAVQHWQLTGSDNDSADSDSDSADSESDSAASDSDSAASDSDLDCE